MGKSHKWERAQEAKVGPGPCSHALRADSYMLLSKARKIRALDFRGCCGTTLVILQWNLRSAILGVDFSGRSRTQHWQVIVTWVWASCQVVDMEGSYRPRSRESFIWLKRDFKKTLFPVSAKRLKSNQKCDFWTPRVTRKWLWGVKKSLPGHFWVAFQQKGKKSLVSLFWARLMIPLFWACSCRLFPERGLKQLLVRFCTIRLKSC